MIRIRRELAPSPVLVQRTIGSGEDKTSLFWIPVRIPGGTRQATRTEMAALFAEQSAITRTPSQANGHRRGHQEHPGGHHRPTTKAVDAAAVLARMLVPEPMRPGWSESLHHAHSVIPHDRLLNIDERLANAAAKPVIIPETINCDRGRVYLSETFLQACTSLGIFVQPARPYSGSDKSIVERTFLSINTLFCQHVAGYARRDTTRRGPDVADEAIWTVAQLQELFDEWVVDDFTDCFGLDLLSDLR